MFTTARDAQTQARMIILQGDNQRASENVCLGEVLLTNLRGFERFQSKVNVAFEIDASGILHVKAIDQDSGEERLVTIRDSFDSEGKALAENVSESETVAPSDRGVPPAITGPFRETELVDVLCFLHANNKNGRVEITGTDPAGTLMLTNGNISHATLGGVQGTDAVRKMLEFNEGYYAFYEGETTSEPAQIDEPFDILVGK
jgi:hypothetical protein